MPKILTEWWELRAVKTIDGQPMDVDWQTVFVNPDNVVFVGEHGKNFYGIKLRDGHVFYIRKQ